MASLKIWTLKDLCTTIELMIPNKFDCIMFIEGNRGLGKSTLAYKLLIRLKIPVPFNPNVDLIFKRDKIIQHLAKKKGGCIFADEMINVGYNRDFYSDEQKILIKGLNMYRDNCNIFVGCIPKFMDLDTQLRRLCKIRLTVVRRGFALIHIQRPSIYSGDVWDTRNNEKIESKWTRKGLKTPKYNQLTTVVGLLHFKDITKKQREIYETIKEERRNQVYSEYSDDFMPLDADEMFYHNLMDRIKEKALTPSTFNEICKVSGKKYETVRRRVNILLKDAGIEGSFKDWVAYNNQVGKKDELGFAKP